MATRARKKINQMSKAAIEKEMGELASGGHTSSKRYIQLAKALMAQGSQE